MTFLTDIKLNFVELVGEYGSEYTLIRKIKTNEFIDPSRPSLGYKETEEEFTISGLVSAYDKKVINKDLIEITDVPMYVSPTIIFDKDTDKVVLNGITYAIVSITPHGVNNSVVYYELQLRD